LIDLHTYLSIVNSLFTFHGCSGAALLVEAANMGDPDAQYELGCHLRIENDYVHSDQQAFYYIEKAVDQVCFSEF
jgi:TPR repeat protein